MSLTEANNNKKGSLLVAVILFIVGISCVLIYLGYKGYRERYYINLYDDKTIDKVLDVPPFTERKTEGSRELLGECDLLVGTSFKQVVDFYSSFSKARGFGFESDETSFEIKVRKGYSVIGTRKDNILEIRWTPVLNLKQAAKCRKIFGYIKDQSS